MAVNAQSEIDKLKGILESCGISEARRKALEPIIENTAWMKVKLDAARDAIKTSNIVIPYDNGGGQKGLRENPMFKGYESLWKSYISGMDKVLSCLPPEVVEAEIVEEEKPKTILELIREKHSKEA